MRSCTEQQLAQVACKLGLTSVHEYGRVCKRNVTHVTLRSRVGHVACTRRADCESELRKVQNVGWDCGWGIAGWTGGRAALAFASHSSFPSPISSLPPALPLAVPVSPHKTPQRSHMKLILSHIHQEEPSCCIAAEWCVAGWRQNCALLIWHCNLIQHTPPITNSKFG